MTEEERTIEKEEDRIVDALDYYFYLRRNGEPEDYEEKISSLLKELHTLQGIKDIYE